MDQEKIGKIIRQIRKTHHLTQKQLADKYGVTYQAVSKWENGKNIHDIALLKQISKDFNIDIEKFLEGEIKVVKSKRIFPVILIIIFVLAIGFFCFQQFFDNKEDFKFKTLTTSCKQFNITGSIAYNKNKSSIYISSINYCGGKDNKNYQKIECILYEENQNTQIKISEWEYNKKEKIKLETFLKSITFNIDNYSSTCKQYSHNNLYLQINATDSNDEITTYKIPLSLNDNCSD